MPLPRPFGDARSPCSSCLSASSSRRCAVAAPQRTPQPPRPCSTAAGAAGRLQELFSPDLRHRLGNGQASSAPHAHSAGATLGVSCRAMFKDNPCTAAAPRATTAGKTLQGSKEFLTSTEKYDWKSPARPCEWRQRCARECSRDG